MVKDSITYFYHRKSLPGEKESDYVVSLLLAAEKRSSRYIQEKIKWKEIFNTLNVNVYFPFLLHSVIPNKSRNNFVLVYFSFLMFNITLNKSKETFTITFSTAQLV
jgi:hypothetical protein